MLKDLFKHSGIYFFGSILSKGLSVLVFILFARTLLPQRFGYFVLFVTLLQVITFFSDFGLNQWYQKRTDEESEDILFSKIINARLLTLLVSLFFSLLFLKLTNSFSPLISTILLLTLIPEAFLSVVDGYYLVLKKPFRVSMKISVRMAILFVGYLLFSKGFSLNHAISLYLIASCLTLLWYFPWKKLKHLTLQFEGIFSTLRNSFAYAFLILTSFAYARGDSLVIGYVLNSTALGIYGAAYRYLESLSLIPTALSQNLFPVSAQKKGITSEQLLKIVSVTFLAGIVFMILTFFFSNFLIVTLLGKSYIAAVPILRIFSVVLLLFFLNSPLATVVQSSKLVERFLPFGALNTIVNIVLNLCFVPFFGITAAAYVMLTTEITGLIINLYFIKKLYSF